MNSYIKYTKVAILLLLMTSLSCSDFLDKVPENRKNVADIEFSNPEIMFSPVSGVYATARSGNGFSFWGALGLMAIRGEDLDKGGGDENDQGALNSARRFQYNDLRTYWALNNTWNGFYNVVIISNSALLELNEFSAYLTTPQQHDLYRQYVAEVRFMRAYAFFFITRFWGDAPLLLDNTITQPHKTSRDSIYMFINSELDSCIKYLPAVRPNEMPLKGQVTRYTALALKAKANADINNWDAVLEASQMIVDSRRFSLYPDFYQSFKIPGELSNESLFELQYTDFGTGSGPAVEPDQWFVFQGPSNTITAPGGRIMGTGWGFLPPTNSLVELFRARGETDRYNTTFLFTGTITPEGDTIAANASKPKQFNGKAYLPSNQITQGRTTYGMGNNVRMLRYADVLLLNAEARVRKGLSGDESFNEVRIRAKMPTLSSVTVDQILEERHIELACEWGDRFFDLVRTGKAAGTLPGFLAGQHEFYPIPQNQIDLNPNLR